MLLQVYASHAAGKSSLIPTCKTHAGLFCLMVHRLLSCTARSLTMSTTLQAQLEALVSTYGVQLSSTDAALSIWTAVVAQSGILSEVHQT